jgi:Protein of unknown function (DUF2585)
MRQITPRQLPFMIATILIGTVIVLQSMGRLVWCQCGSPVPWSWEIWSMHNSQHLLDPYFFSHVLHGVIFFAVLFLWRKQISANARFFLAFVVEAGWEILENSPFIIERYRAATMSLDYFGDSMANSMFDILACMLGYWFAASVRWYWSVALFAVFEFAMLVSIRDCLILNVIMLVSPIEAIKQWQMG